MTYKAHIDNIKAKTGKTPEDYLKMAKEKGLVKCGELLKWLKVECGLGHGHANAIILYIQDPKLAKRKTAEDARKEKSMEDNPKIRKNMVRNYFKLIMQLKQKDGLRFFTANCKLHNPYVKGGMGALFDAMSAVQHEPMKYPDPNFSVKKIMADGNMVAAHTELLFSQSKPSEGGLRQVHLFRFNKSNKIWSTGTLLSKLHRTCRTLLMHSRRDERT